MNDIIPQDVVKSSNTATGGWLAFPNSDLMDKLLRTLNDEDAYETDEAKPSQKLISCVATILGNIRCRRDFEVYPHLGTINVTWRNTRKAARLKATFASDATLTIYVEQMLLGKVSDNKLIRNASVGDLEKYLSSLYSA